MSASRGHYFLLQAVRPSAAPLNLAGLSTKSFTLTAAPHEQLAFPTDRWQALRAASGRLSMQLSGNGLFIDKTGEQFVLSHFLDGAALPLNIIVPDFGKFSGAFLTTQLSLQTRQSDLMIWRVALQSAGDIDFEMV